MAHAWIASLISLVCLNAGHLVVHVQKKASISCGLLVTMTMVMDALPWAVAVTWCAAQA